MKTIFTKLENKVTWKCPGCGIEISEKQNGCDVCNEKYGKHLLESSSGKSEYELATTNGERFKFSTSLISGQWLIIEGCQVKIEEISRVQIIVK